MVREEKTPTSLYDIERMFSEALEATEIIDPETGEVITQEDAEFSDQVKEIIDHISTVEADTIDRIAHAIRKREAVISFIKAEEKRLAQKRKTAENRLQSLKDFILSALLTFNRKAVEGHASKLAVRESQVVALANGLDPITLPEKYRETVTEIKVRKVDIRNDLKLGIDVPGARLETNYSLNIR